MLKFKTLEDTRACLKWLCETQEDNWLVNIPMGGATLIFSKKTYNVCIDTCLSYLPGEGEPLEESTMAWQDHLTIIETLGAEGQSSDETDEEDPNIYNVRTLPWHSKELVMKIAMTDKARNTTNGYGNP
jgi:hypothetical protein